MQGHIHADIRARIPPASIKDQCDQQDLHIWNLLERCWTWEPNNRPTARVVLDLLDTSQVEDASQRGEVDYPGWGIQDLGGPGVKDYSTTADDAKGVPYRSLLQASRSVLSIQSSSPTQMPAVKYTAMDEPIHYRSFHSTAPTAPSYSNARIPIQDLVHASSASLPISGPPSSSTSAMIATMPPEYTSGPNSSMQVLATLS